MSKFEPDHLAADARQLEIERAIEGGTCWQCAAGVIAISFRDSESRQEYKIAGLCQNCQDRLYRSRITLTLEQQARATQLASHATDPANHEKELQTLRDGFEDYAGDIAFDYGFGRGQSALAAWLLGVEPGKE